MNKLSLALVTGSILSTAALLDIYLDQPALAVSKNTQHNALQQSLVSNFSAHFACDQSECIGNSRSVVAVATQKSTPSTPKDSLELNFTDEESDAAIAKYGCDCVTSINLLRQARGITVGVNGEYLPLTQSVGKPH